MGSLAATNNTLANNLARGGSGGSGGAGGQCAGNGGSGGAGGSANGGAVMVEGGALFSVNNTIANCSVTGGVGGSGGLRGACGSFVHGGVNGQRGPEGAGGGGLAVRGTGGSAALYHTILAYNTPANSSGALSDGAFNVSSDGSCAFTAPSSLNHTDPKLDALAANGGPTLTMALLPNSPAIDLGNDTVAPMADQRGVARPQGLTSDAGAFEFVQAPVPVCDETILRQAVATGGFVRLQCDGVFPLSEPLVIDRDLTIDGSSRRITINGRGAMRVFHVLPSVNLTLSNVVIVNGRSSSGSGLFNDGGNVTLVNCSFQTNVAIGRAGASGTNAPDGGSPGVAGSDGFPGEDACGGAIYNDGTLTLLQTELLGNRAQGGAGGRGGNGGHGAAVIDSRGRCISGVRGGDGGNGGRGGAGVGGAIYNRGLLTGTFVSCQGNGVFGGAAGNGATPGSGGCGAPGSVGGDGGAGGSASGGAVFNAGFMLLVASTAAQNICSGGAGGAAETFPPLPPGIPGDGGDALGGAVANAATNEVLNVTLGGNICIAGARGGGSALVGSAAGGALHNVGQLTARHCTFWNNNAGSGGTTIYNQTNSAALENCILGNLNSTSNCVGILTDLGHNICSDASASFTAAGSLNSTDPSLTSLDDHGGPVLTFGLRSGSPALNHGNASGCTATDARGVPRPQGPGCDVGAFEATYLAIQRTASGIRLSTAGPPNEHCTIEVGNVIGEWTTIFTGTANALGSVEFTFEPQNEARFFRSRTP